MAGEVVPPVLEVIVTADAVGDSITVTTGAELVAALQDANDYEVIYLGTSINLTSGAAINAAKTRVVIDGAPPGYSGSGRGFTLNQSTTNTNHIHMASGYACGEVTFRNMAVDSTCHYGLLWMDTSQYGVTVTLDNVEYYGPQAATNPRGTVVLRDSVFNITTRSLLYSGELAEAGAVVLDGAVTATSSCSFDLFKFEYSGSILVKSGSTVNLSGSYALLGASSGIYPDITVEPGASFTTAVDRGVGGGSQTGNIRVMEDASWAINQSGSETYNGINLRNGYTLDIAAGAGLSLTQTLNGTGGGIGISSGGNIIVGGSLIVRHTADTALVWPGSESYAMDLRGSFTVLPGARLEVYQFQHQGLSTGGRAMNLAASTQVSFQNPDRVILYSAGAKAISTASGSSIQIAAGALNQWTSKPSLPVTTKPTNIWSSGDGGSIGVQVSNSSVSGQSGVILASPEAGITSFKPANAYLVTFGNLLMTLDDVLDTSEAITGTAPSDASMAWSTYVGQSGATRTLSGTAPDGYYSLDTVSGDFPKEKTKVEVFATKDSLTALRHTTVIPGLLELIYVPEFINFGVIPLPDHQTLYPPQACDVMVSDTRGAKSSGELTLSLEDDLTCTGSCGHTLPEALVFLPEAELPILLGAAAVPVYSAAESSLPGQLDTRLSFGADYGPQLQIDPSMAPQIGETYTTVLHWSLVDGP